MVAVHKDPAKDGRLAAAFGSGSSICACPNVNEVPTPVSSVEPRLGVYCGPPATLAADPNRAFTLFDPVKDQSNVIDATREPTDTSNVIQKEISLPASATASSSLIKYRRGIHKCQIGYVLNKTSPAAPKCDWDVNAHLCNASSPLPTKTKENNAFPAWDQIINKRAACCSNDMNAATTSSTVRFDCVDNTAFAKTATFNQLWASDPSTTGGQLNAMVIAEGNNIPLTGWFTSDGRRCLEFSEFTNTPIIPGTVPPLVVTGQQETVTANWVATGTALPMPSGAAFSDIITRLGPKARAPNPSAGTQIELNNARRCPILVRAAMITRCPGTTTAGQNLPRFTVTDSAGITRCPSADSIQIHVRIEQIFRIAGEPQMPPIDTITDQKSVGTINVGDVIRNKNGGQCLPGMQMSGSMCRY
jgi:hypothetical protein